MLTTSRNLARIYSVSLFVKIVFCASFYHNVLLRTIKYQENHDNSPFLLQGLQSIRTAKIVPFLFFRINLVLRVIFLEIISRAWVDVRWKPQKNSASMYYVLIRAIKEKTVNWHKVWYISATGSAEFENVFHVMFGHRFYHVLLPEGPCCVFYATRRQVHWGLTHVVFLLVLWSDITHTQRYTIHAGANRLTHLYEYILTPSVMCSQQLCVLHRLNNLLIYIQASYSYKRVLGAAKLASVNKTKESITSRNLALGTFGELLIVFSTNVNLLYFIYSTARRCCLLHLIKQNCLLKTFLRTLILMARVSLYLFSLLKLIWNCIIFL